MLADFDKFLPPGVPATDTVSFTWGLIERSRNGSNDLRLFAMGWYEHLDQDKEFYNSVLEIQIHHPDYTDYDIRLGFDYLSITRHPTDVNVTFVMNHTEIVDAIRGGFTNITREQIKQAIWDYVYSESIEKPGLLTQQTAAQIFGILYPVKVFEMEDEYNSYFGKVTDSYYNPFIGDFTNDSEKYKSEDIDMRFGLFFKIKKKILGRKSMGSPPPRT